MPIRHLLMDLDETLYPSSSQLWPLIKYRINEYLINRIGIDPFEVDAIREKYHDSYGTTLRGLLFEKDINMDDYLDFVHDVPVEEVIQIDQALITTLESIAVNKFIFTNASRKHSERVLDALGIKQQISTIISIEDLYPWCKPNEEAFKIAMDKINVTDYSTCLFIDDSPKNIETGMKLGFITIQINSKKLPSSAHYSIQNFVELSRIVPQLNLEG